MNSEIVVYKRNRIDLLELSVWSDYIKENEGLGLITPNGENGCFIFDYKEILIPKLKAILPNVIGFRSYLEYRRYRWNNRFSEEVVIFEREAIKSLFKKIGIKAPSKYYRGKGSFTIRLK